MEGSVFQLLVDYRIEGMAAIGASLILFAFYRTSIGRWSGKSFWYEFDNLVGSFLLAGYALYKHSYVTLILNAIWVVAAVRGISSIAERRVTNSGLLRSTKHRTKVASKRSSSKRK